jgi:hypothetical protein
MKLLSRLAMVLGVVLIVAIGIAFVLPRHVHVERSVHINAPAQTIFALADDITRFNDWSPWAAIDPQTRYTFTGPARGAGATMRWMSENPDVGSGEMTITGAEPGEAVHLKMDFGHGRVALSDIVVQPHDGGVLTTWSFDTDLGYSIVGRYLGLFMDRMLGPDFETGLDKLKQLAERSAQGQPEPS